MRTHCHATLEEGEPRHSQMRLVVIIATANRPDLIGRLLKHLDAQRRPADEVIISAPDETHVGSPQKHAFITTYLYGKRGLTAQRNLGLDHALGRADIVTFFDDDFLPASDYLQRVAAAFEEHPDWVVVRGHAVKDGANGPGMTFEAGLATLRSIERSRSSTLPEVIRDEVGGYGCNMSVRAAHIGDLRFDERLVLYGWQEDIDFTCQLRPYGRVVSLSTLIGVHLGVKSGRLSGVRFGYSQIINPIYLIKKGTIPIGFAARLMGRNLTANIAKSVWPEPYVDRRGRLKGNLLAAFHLIQGKVTPEYVLRL
jgi:GT2 family glycosyltransferase